MKIVFIMICSGLIGTPNISQMLNEYATYSAWCSFITTFCLLCVYEEGYSIPSDRYVYVTSKEKTFLPSCFFFSIFLRSPFSVVASFIERARLWRERKKKMFNKKEKKCHGKMFSDCARTFENVFRLQDDYFCCRWFWCLFLLLLHSYSSFLYYSIKTPSNLMNTNNDKKERIINSYNN